MDTQSNDVQIEYAMIGKLIIYIVIIFIVPLLVVNLSLKTYSSLYEYFYDPPFSYRRTEEGGYTPIGLSTMSNDAYRNAEIMDRKKNMILVLTLPNHHKGEPISNSKDGYVSWWSRPRSNSFTTFESNYGHVVDVRLHKDSFVVVDGMTGEELIVHPITKEQGEQWRKGFPYFEHDGNRYDNLLEGSFNYFSLPKEKFLEIQEKVNQHDTSNEEDGPGYRFYGEFIPDRRKSS